jgi:hypothetical protein
MGKSTTIDWLNGQFNQPERRTLAISLTAQSLEKCGVADLLDSKQAVKKSPLVDAVAKRVGNSNRDEIVVLLKRLRSQGELILLIDALDEVGEKSKAVDRLQTLFTAPDWSGSRMILSGRPYSLATHWRKLFPNNAWRTGDSCWWMSSTKNSRQNIWVRNGSRRFRKTHGPF